MAVGAGQFVPPMLESRVEEAKRWLDENGQM
jgi:hypothetical protein